MYKVVQKWPPKTVQIVNKMWDMGIALKKECSENKENNHNNTYMDILNLF